jgi:hypothetical protein
VPATVVIVGSVTLSNDKTKQSGHGAISQVPSSIDSNASSRDRSRTDHYLDAFNSTATIHCQLIRFGTQFAYLPEIQYHMPL